MNREAETMIRNFLMLLKSVHNKLGTSFHFGWWKLSPACWQCPTELCLHHWQNPDLWLPVEIRVRQQMPPDPLWLRHTQPTTKHWLLMPGPYVAFSNSFSFSEAYKHMKLVYYIHITVDVQWIELILCWFNKDFWTFHINSLLCLIGHCPTDLFSDWFILLLVYRYTCGVYPGVCTQVMETHVGTPETFHVCHIAVKALHITKILASH